MTEDSAAPPSYWHGRGVLVTGAGGFIGSHLTEALVRSGASVRAFVRYNSRNDYGWLDTSEPDVRESIEIFRGDLANPEAVAGAVAGNEVIMHLGALIPIPYSYQHPREFVTANVTGALNVLEAARRSDVRRIVHTSTSEVYGTPETVPIGETHRLHPQSPYAATKVAADQLALSYNRSFGTPVVVVRPFNTFGPRQSARAVIPTIISQALAGDGIRLGALDTTRDFTFVSDTVAGFMQCGLAPDVEGEVINLGTGSEISIEALVAKIGSLMGREIRVSLDDQRVRPGDSEVERLVADTSKAEALLGWRAEVDLDRGLSETITWLRGSASAYKPAIYNV